MSKRPCDIIKQLVAKNKHLTGVDDPSDTKSKALILYLGYGITPYPSPKVNPQRLIDRYGYIKGAELVVYCKKVLEELYSIVPEGTMKADEYIVYCKNSIAELDNFASDWAGEKIWDATNRAVAHVVSVYPELSDNALKALASDYSFNYR